MVEVTVSLAKTAAVASLVWQGMKRCTCNACVVLSTAFKSAADLTQNGHVMQSAFTVITAYNDAG